MSVTRQLYQLQETDSEIESGEQALSQKASQLGESQALIEARTRLASGQQRLDELRHKQHASEWEIDDLASKIAVIEEKLYSGRIRNPKELTDLQSEFNALKAKRDQLETKALETMDQAELAEASVAAASSELKQVEREWQSQQQHLSAEIDQLKDRLSGLRHKRQQLLDGIEQPTVELYEKLRKQKGQALARVEQGICQGCRISLSSHEIKQARSGDLVQCSSCGRMIYLP